MIPNKILKQAAAWITALCFVATNYGAVSPSAYAQPEAAPSLAQTGLASGQNVDISKIEIPTQFGRIEETHEGSNGRTIVLIQDAHAVPDAQRSIRDLIGYFGKQYGIGLVALEGASTPLDPQIFRSFPEREPLKKLIGDYLERGEISGVTAAAILNDSSEVGSSNFQLPTRYVGIEDWSVYEEGLADYLKAVSRKEKILAQLNAIESRLEAKKQKIYSADLLEIDRALRGFAANRTELSEVLRVLASKRPLPEGSQLKLLAEEARADDVPRAFEQKIKRTADAIRKALKPQKSEGPGAPVRRQFNGNLQRFLTSEITSGEFALFLMSFVRKNNLPVEIPGDLRKVAERHRTLNGIEGTAIFRELEVYARSVKAAYFRDETEKEIDQKSERLGLLRKLTALELRREEWEAVKKVKSKKEKVKNREVGMWFAGNRGGATTDHRSQWMGLFAPHCAFYRNAEKRDEIFAEKIRALTDERSEKLSAVVAGGFHTKGLAERLKTLGFSYVLIVPNIGTVPERTNYEAQMRGKVPWGKYFEVKDGKIDLYAAFVRATRDRLLQEVEDGGRKAEGKAKEQAKREEKQNARASRKSQGVAKRNGAGQADLSINKEFSEGRTIWNNSADAQSRGIDSRQYRRRQGTVSQEGMSSVSVHKQRIGLRTNDTDSSREKFGLSDGLRNRDAEDAIDRGDRYVERTDQSPLITSFSSFDLPSSTFRLLKQWRDQILRDLAAQRQLERAGEYTRFLDEMKSEVRSSAPLAFLAGPASAPRVSRRVLQDQWLSNISRFMNGLWKLQNEKRMTADNILNLLPGSAMQSAYALGINRDYLTWLQRNVPPGVPFEMRQETEMEAEADSFERPEIRTSTFPETMPEDWSDFDFFDLDKAAGQIRTFEDWMAAADQRQAGELLKSVTTFLNAFHSVWKIKRTEVIERDYLEPLSRIIRMAREKSERDVSATRASAGQKQSSGLSSEVEAAIRVLYVHEKSFDILHLMAERDRVFGGTGIIDGNIIYQRGLEAFKQLEIKPGERVLEVGAGKFGGIGLVAAIAGAHVTAFENYPGALRELKLRLKDVQSQIDAAGGTFRLVEKDFSSETARKDMPPEGFDHVIATDIVTPTAYAAAANKASPLTADSSSVLRILQAVAQLKNGSRGSVLLSVPEFYSVQDRRGRPIRTIKKVPFDDDLLQILRRAGKQAQPNPAYVAVPFSLGVKRGVLFKVQSIKGAGERSELRSRETDLGLKSSADLLYNAGFSNFHLSGLTGLRWVREKRFNEYEIRMGFVRKLIQETADEVSAQTRQPVFAQVYGSSLYLQDEDGFVPVSAVDDIDIQFSHFLDGKMERLFLAGLTENLKRLTPDLSIEIQEANRLQTEKYFLVERRTNQKVLISFHKLIHETPEDKWESIREFFGRPFVKPVERYLFIERLVGELQIFEEKRRQYLQGKLPADQIRENLEQLRIATEKASASKEAEARMLDRMGRRILEMNTAVRAVALWKGLSDGAVQISEVPEDPATGRAEMRSQQRFFYPPESTAAYELIKALQLEKTTIIEERVKDFKQGPVFIQTIECSDLMSEGYTILSELGPPGLRRFDLLYDERGYLFAILPRPDAAELETPLPPGYRFFLLSEYFIEVPQPGDWPDEEVARLWAELARSEIAQKVFVAIYLEELYGPNASMVKEYYPKEARSRQLSYAYAELNLETGALELTDFSPLTFRADLYNHRRAGKAQLIFPIFPTVYSPAAWWNRNSDRIYLEALFPGKEAIARGEDFLGLNAESSILVPFTGSGFDSWVIHQAVLCRIRLEKNGGPVDVNLLPPIRVIDKNPLAVANSKTLAKIGGFRLIGKVADNIIGPFGVPAYDEKFTAVAANMPFVSFQPRERRSLTDIWDFDNGGVLVNFSLGLPLVLDRTRDPRVVAWNSPGSTLDYFVLRNLESAGRFDESNKMNGKLVFDVIEEPFPSPRKACSVFYMKFANPERQSLDARAAGSRGEGASDGFDTRSDPGVAPEVSRAGEPLNLFEAEGDGFSGMTDAADNRKNEPGKNWGQRNRSELRIAPAEDDEEVAGIYRKEMADLPILAHLGANSKSPGQLRLSKEALWLMPLKSMLSDGLLRIMGYFPTSEGQYALILGTGKPEITRIYPGPAPLEYHRISSLRGGKKTIDFVFQIRLGQVQMRIVNARTNKDLEEGEIEALSQQTSDPAGFREFARQMSAGKPLRQILAGPQSPGSQDRRGERSEMRMPKRVSLVAGWAVKAAAFLLAQVPYRFSRIAVRAAIRWFSDWDRTQMTAWTAVFIGMTWAMNAYLMREEEGAALRKPPAAAETAQITGVDSIGEFYRKIEAVMKELENLSPHSDPNRYADRARQLLALVDEYRRLTAALRENPAQMPARTAEAKNYEAWDLARFLGALLVKSADADLRDAAGALRKAFEEQTEILLNQDPAKKVFVDGLKEEVARSDRDRALFLKALEAEDPGIFEGYVARSFHAEDWPGSDPVLKTRVQKFSGIWKQSTRPRDFDRFRYVVWVSSDSFLESDQAIDYISEAQAPLPEEKKIQDARSKMSLIPSGLGTARELGSTARSEMQEKQIRDAGFKMQDKQQKLKDKRSVTGAEGQGDGWRSRHGTGRRDEALPPTLSPEQSTDGWHARKRSELRTEDSKAGLSESNVKTKTAVAAALLYLAVGSAYLAFNYFVFVPLGDRYLAGAPVMQMGMMGLLGSWVGIPLAAKLQKVLKPEEPVSGREVFRRMLWAVPLSFGFGALLHGYFVFGWLYRLAPDWGILTPFIMAFFNQTLLAPLLFDPMGYLIGRMTTGGMSYSRAVKDMAGDQISYSVLAYVIWLPVIFAGLCFKNPILTYLITSTGGFIWGAVHLLAVTAKIIPSFESLRNLKLFRKLQTLYERPQFGIYVLSATVLLYLGILSRLLYVADPNPWWTAGVFGAGGAALAVALRKKNIERLYRSGGDWGKEKPSRVPSDSRSELRSEGTPPKTRSQRNFHKIQKAWDSAEEILRTSGRKLKIRFANFYHEEGEKTNLSDLPGDVTGKLYENAQIASFELPKKSVAEFVAGRPSIIAEENPFWKKMLAAAKERVRGAVFGADANSAARYITHIIRLNYQDPRYQDRFKANYRVRLDSDQVDLADIGVRPAEGRPEHVNLKALLPEGHYAELMKNRMVLVSAEQNPYGTGSFLLYFPPHKTIRAMFDRIAAEYDGYFRQIGLEGQERYHFIQQFFFTHAMIADRDITQVRVMGEVLSRFLRETPAEKLPETLKMVHTGGVFHLRTLNAILKEAGVFDKEPTLTVEESYFDPREPIPQGIHGSSFFSDHISEILDHTEITSQGVRIDTDFYVNFFGRFLNETPHGYRLGAYLMDLGKYEHAISAFENSLGLYSDDAALESALAKAYYWDSLRLSRLGHQDGSREWRKRASGYAQRALALSDRAWMARDILARLYYDQNDLVNAEKQMREVLALHPKYPEGWYVLGNCRRFLKGPEAALDSIKEGLRQMRFANTDLKRLLWRELAVDYRKLGNDAAARAIGTKYMDSPETANTPEMLERIFAELDGFRRPGSRSELRSDDYDWDALALDLLWTLELSPVYGMVRNEVESTRRFLRESLDELVTLKGFVLQALVDAGWSQEGADWAAQELMPRIAYLIEENLKPGPVSWGARFLKGLRSSGAQISGLLFGFVAAGLWLVWIAYLKILNPPHLKNDDYHFDRRLRNVEESLKRANGVMREKMPPRYELLGAQSGLQQALYTNLWIFNILSERAKLNRRQIERLVRAHRLGEFLEAKLQTRLDQYAGGDQPRNELRTALPPEGMASYELIKALELEKAIAVGERKPGPEGTSITVQRIELPENDRRRLSGGLRILSSELAPTTDREEKVLETNQFDLVFNDRDYLIAVIPVVPQKVLHRVGFDVLKYFDLSAYHFEIPSLGDARIVEKWGALAGEIEKDRQAIAKYHKELFGELSGKVSSYSHGIGGVESKSYLYGELNRETGELVLHEFNPREFRFFIDFIRSRPATGTEKIVVPLFPSVYSPAIRQHKKPDEKFYRAIYVSAAEAGTPADFMDLKPTDRVLVPFAGSGLDTWLAYQAMLRRWNRDAGQGQSNLPEFDITASDKNPLAVANVRTFAKLAGMKIQTGVFDNIISESGETISARKWTKIIANMPSFKPEVAAHRVMPVESLVSYWDKEGGGVLRRFAAGLPAVLDPDSDPRVLAWNTPFFPNETVLPETDLVAKILESAGEYSGGEGQSGRKVFDVHAAYQRTLNYWSGVYRLRFPRQGISYADSRSELREAAVSIAMVLKPGQDGPQTVKRAELSRAAKIIEREVDLEALNKELVAVADSLALSASPVTKGLGLKSASPWQVIQNLHGVVLAHWGKRPQSTRPPLNGYLWEGKGKGGGITPSTVQSELDLLNRQVLTPETSDKTEESSYAIGISFAESASLTDAGELDELMREVVERDPHLAHVLSVGKERPPKAFLDILRKRHMIPKSVPKPQAKNVELPDESQGAIPVAMIANRIQTMNEKLIPVAFEENEAGEDLVKIYGNRLKSAVVVHLARLLKADKTLQKHPEELNQKLLARLNQFEHFESPLRWSNQDGRLSVRISAKAVREYFAARSVSEAA